MKNLVTSKTLKKWAKYCGVHYPLAMKHLASTLNQSQDEKNILVYVFNNLDDEKCQGLIKKFFFYQKILDITEQDFTQDAMKKRLENVFPTAQERYSKMEVSVRDLNRPVQEKHNPSFQSQADDLVSTKEGWSPKTSSYVRPAPFIPPYRDVNHDIPGLTFEDECQLIGGRSFLNLIRLDSYLD